MHGGTSRKGRVAPHLEGALVGHAQVALPDVVQQVLDALGDALALRIDGLLLRLGVEGERVAGRRGGHPLLDREAHARLGLFVGIDGFGHAQHRAAVEQVHGGGKCRQRIAAPGFTCKAPVARWLGIEALAPELGGFRDVLLLDRLQLFGRNGELRQLGHLCRLRHLPQRIAADIEGRGPLRGGLLE
jgi:hypothetical protein